MLTQVHSRIFEIPRDNMLLNRIAVQYYQEWHFLYYFFYIAANLQSPPHILKLVEPEMKRKKKEEKGHTPEL